MPENKNPDGTLKFTEQQWAQKQVFNKMKSRIDTIAIADETYKSTDVAKPYVGPDTLPTPAEIRNIKEVAFEIKGDWAALKTAVDAELAKLKTAYPAYTFKVKYGP